LQLVITVHPDKFGG